MHITPNQTQAQQPAEACGDSDPLHLSASPSPMPFPAPKSNSSIPGGGADMDSLEKLLAEDGFRNKEKAKTPAVTARAVSMPLLNAGSSSLKSRPRSGTLIYGRSKTAASRNERNRFELDRQPREDSRRDGGIESGKRKPSIRDAATRAVISILTSHVEAFSGDHRFRASMHRGFNACLGKNGDGVSAKLEQAITLIEKAAAEGRGAKELLKKASRELTVITELNPVDFMRDESISGILNSNLAACAHLYLGVLSNIRKKDRIAADHLLQVFCDAPFEARTILLPTLWELFFLPHLSHLIAWYEQEMQSLARVASRAKKIKILEKMHNDVLDMGTHKFAVYYKEWLADESKAPPLPSIHAPSACFQRIMKERSHTDWQDEVVNPFVSQKFHQSDLANEMEIKEHEEEGEKGIGVDMHPSKSKGRLDESKGTVVNHPRSLKNERAGDQEQEDQRNCFEKLEASSNAKENEHTLKKLAKAIFELDAVDCNSYNNSANQKQIASKNWLDDNVPLSEVRRTDSGLKKPEKSKHCSFSTFQDDYRASLISPELFDICEDIDQGSIFSNIPANFVCPLTGHPFNDPVTIETGHTFERRAIIKWLSETKTCPATGKQIELQAALLTNSVLKQLVDAWISAKFRNLMLLTAQAAQIETKNRNKSSMDGLAMDILDRLLAGYEQQIENARNLIALGGLRFLMHRLRKGNLKEKIRVFRFLLCCVKARGCCRKFLADNLERSCVLELLHSEQVGARSTAVMLLVELICLNRRRDITSFLRSLLSDRIADTMHVLLVHLHSSPPEEKALVAVLLIHFDLMLGGCNRSIYKEEAMDGITQALNHCLLEQKAIPSTQRALLMLGGRFSPSGESLMDSWLLRRGEDEGEEDEDEEQQKEKWTRDVSRVIAGGGRKSFLYSLCRCLSSGDQNLARTCLVTVAWISSAFASLPAAAAAVRDQMPQAALSDFIARLEEQIDQNNEQIENRMLASISFQNLNRISRCGNFGTGLKPYALCSS